MLIIKRERLNINYFNCCCYNRRFDITKQFVWNRFVNNQIVDIFNEIVVKINNFNKHCFDNEINFEIIVVEIAINDY